LFRLTRAWPYACVPVVVFVLLETACIFLALRFVKPWLDTALVVPADFAAGLGWFGRALRWALSVLAVPGSWLGTLGAVVLGWLVSLFLSQPLSSPALERIVGIVERDLGAPERAPLSFLGEFWCGLRSALVSAAVTVPVIIALTLLELVFPVAAVVTTPLKLLIGALGVAWSLFDYPLTLRGVGARQRVALMRRHLTVVLGFGLAFALVAAIPCCGVLLMLPLGVVAATQLLWEIERAQLEAAQ
jgi:CysZ protein